MNSYLTKNSNQIALIRYFLFIYKQLNINDITYIHQKIFLLLMLPLTSVKIIFFSHFDPKIFY